MARPEQGVGAEMIQILYQISSPMKKSRHPLYKIVCLAPSLRCTQGRGRAGEA